MRYPSQIFVLTLVAALTGNRASLGEPGPGPESDSKDAKTQSTADVMEIWRQDSAILLRLIEEIRPLRESPGDSEVQQKARRKKFDAALMALNRKYIGTLIKLSAVRVKDVRAERVFNENGRKKARELIRKMQADPSTAAFVGDGNIENNPLLAWTLMMQLALVCDDKCFTETGRFEIEYSIPVPAVYQSSGPYDLYSSGASLGESDDQAGQRKTMSVEITRIIKSEQEALAIQKDSIIPLSGKVKSIVYKGGAYSESLQMLME